MEPRYAHRLIDLPTKAKLIKPADLKRMQKLQKDNSSDNPPKAPLNKFFVVLGMRAGDMGYHHVMREISKLGSVAHFNEGLLFLTTDLSIDTTFKKINKSIIDPRIPNDVGLVLLDYKESHAKWYLNREVSQALIELWHNRSNLFVCHDNASNHQVVYDINALGHAIPISEHIWYVSTDYSPKDAYRILSSAKEKDTRLTIFDAKGKIKTWQTERNHATVQIPQPAPVLPTHASIHQPNTWQASMLAEFL